MSPVMNASKIIATYADYTRAIGQFVPSPCVSVCHVGPASQVCDGCLRTLDEIAAWSGLDEDGKRVVWQRLVQRATDALEGAGAGTKAAAGRPPESAAAPEPGA